MKKVLIIGSGLSGLSCARYLDRNTYDVHIFEKNSVPGGRVGSDIVDGNICDVGFQVLLNNYDEVRRLDVYDKLNLKYFDSGAQIYTNNKILGIYNPITHPLKFLQSNIFKVFTISDIFGLIKSFFSKSSIKYAGEFINNTFSKKSQKLFFYPFFKGVFLSKELKTDNIFFLKIFKKFALGKAALPKEGMKALPESIISMYDLKINYNHELIKIDSNTALFKDQKSVDFDMLILAMPLHSINEYMNMDLQPEYNYNKTIYIKSSKNILDKSILLIPDESFKINSIQCLSNISKEYSSGSDHLYSVSTLNHNTDDEELLSEFKSITEISEEDIDLIKSYTITNALPKDKTSLESINDVFFCGDWASEPSIDGAIKSGRLLAEKLNGMTA